MKTLEQLLVENYDELKDPECRIMVIDLLRCNKVLDSDDIFFVKKLTKVIGHLIAENKNITVSMLKKACFFHLYGLELVKKEREAGNTDISLLKMDAHLNSHYADCAKRMFEASNDIIWGQRWYLHYMRSADLSTDVDKVHQAYSLLGAGEAAHGLLLFTGDIRYAGLSMDTMIRSIKIFESVDPDAKSTYHNNILAIYNEISDLAFFAFRMTIDVKWAHICYDYGMLNAESSVSKLTTAAFDEAAARAYRFYESSCDPGWLERSYLSKIRSAEVTESLDPKHSAHAYSYAGHHAAEIFELTGEDEWANKAIFCYKIWLKHYANNPDFSMETIQDKMKENIFLLKQAKHSTDAWLEYLCPDPL